MRDHPQAFESPLTLSTHNPGNTGIFLRLIVALFGDNHEFSFDLADINLSKRINAANNTIILILFKINYFPIICFNKREIC